MFYGMVKAGITEPGFNFEHALNDIESLNKLARLGQIEVTAVSVHAFAYLADRYSLLRYGASMGGIDYGPRLVARSGFNLKDGKVRTLAIPGELTSAALALKIYLREQGIEAELVNVFFDKVQDAVKSGEVDAGIIIHEGQLTHSREGLVTVLDLGQWWWTEHNLPLPLGINIVRKDLGPEAMRAAASILKRSISCALDNRDKALDYALTYGRGISKADADTFVGMYVNERTLDIGPDGMQSIRLFLTKAKQFGFIPKEFSPEQIDFV